MEYRIAHSKFQGTHPVGKNSTFTRVVTSAWTFNPDNNVLTYGATVFKRTSGTEHWTRREHKRRAVERFRNAPVRVVLDFPPSQHLNSIAIDWFIASKLVYFHGTHDHQPPEKLSTVSIPDDFNQTYRLTSAFNNNFCCEEGFPENRNHLNSCWFSFGACIGILGTVACQHFLM